MSGWLDLNLGRLRPERLISNEMASLQIISFARRHSRPSISLGPYERDPCMICGLASRSKAMVMSGCCLQFMELLTNISL